LWNILHKNLLHYLHSITTKLDDYMLQCVDNGWGVTTTMRDEFFKQLITDILPKDQISLNFDILRLSKPRPILWYALKLTPNLKEFRLKNSYQYEIHQIDRYQTRTVNIKPRSSTDIHFIFQTCHVSRNPFKLLLKTYF